MDVKIFCQGIVEKLGAGAWACAEPNESSMYRNSLAEMQGCFDGLSNPNQSQKPYQIIPMTPEFGKKKKWELWRIEEDITTISQALTVKVKWCRPSECRS